METRTDPALAPIVKTLDVNADPNRAFDVFTREFGTWWPARRMAVSPHEKGKPPRSVTMETFPGGRIYETAPDGEEFEWGTVSVFEPGRRLEFSWRPGLSEDKATRVKVRFEPGGAGCRITLVHDGWEARPGGREARGDYVPGWDYVFGQCYAHHVPMSGKPEPT